MVTVEAAYALAAIAGFLVLGIGAVGGVAAQLACTDAAREVARLAALGDASALRVGAQIAPDGARISVDETGDVVVAVVAARLPMVPISVRARSVAAREDADVEAAAR